MWMRESASTTRVLVAFSIVNFVFPLCRTRHTTHQHQHNLHPSALCHALWTSLFPHSRADTITIVVCGMQKNVQHLASQPPYTPRQMLSPQRLQPQPSIQHLASRMQARQAGSHNNLHLLIL